MLNAELNDVMKHIFMRKSDVSLEKNSICNVSEKLAEHGRHCCYAMIPMTSLVCCDNSSGISNCFFGTLAE